jgi:VWFA-related protein
MSNRATFRSHPGVLFLIGLAVVAAWPAGAVQQPPSQQPQVFRAGTDIVPVYATVRDPGRGFVLDLTADDFELYDEGKRQAVTQFTIAAQPLSVVMLIDGSSSMMTELNRAIEGARNLVLRMLPEDRAKIGSFADRVVLGPRFTSNRDELLKYLDDQFNLRSH